MFFTLLPLSLFMTLGGSETELSLILFAAQKLREKLPQRVAVSQAYYPRV
jgi:hypothetical protein